MNKLFGVMLLLVLSPTAWANFGEFFGSAYSTSAVGNQATGDHHDPANNFYNPALLAFADRVALSMNIAHVKHNFSDANGIVIRNSTNKNLTTAQKTDPSNFDYGNVSGDYGDVTANSLHLLLPIRRGGLGNVALSLFTPLATVMEINTGSDTAPEYVMYRARYRRTVLQLNYAHPFTDDLAISLGAHVGFQSGADLGFQAALSGSDHASSANSRIKIKPSLGAIFSTTYRFSPDSHMYFSYTQQMKSNFEANTIGETSTPSIPFDTKIQSMIYYDPHIFRLGSLVNFNFLELITTVEYQLWDDYKTPAIRIEQRSSIKGSSSYEQLRPDPIFVPKIGIRVPVTEALKFSLGAAYRPSPLDNNLNSAGNSIDANSFIVTGGSNFSFELFERSADIGLALQYRKLESKNVSKTSGQENGLSGLKIGAPGYPVGGEVFSAMLGANIIF